MGRLSKVTIVNGMQGVSGSIPLSSTISTATLSELLITLKTRLNIQIGGTIGGILTF